jgi:hypothetical protein
VAYAVTLLVAQQQFSVFEKLKGKFQKAYEKMCITEHKDMISGGEAV